MKEPLHIEKLGRWGVLNDADLRGLFEGARAGRPVLADLVAAVTRKREALILGWIAYVAMQDPASPHITPQALHAYFGEWLRRAPQMRSGRWWI